MIGDQCQYGLKSRDEQGEGPAKKFTGFMTNSPCVAFQLKRSCPNRIGYQVRRHVQLQGGRTRAAQVYPPELCKVICTGLMNQIEADKRGQYLFLNVEYSDERSSQEFMNIAKELSKKYKTVEEDNDVALEIAWDDVSGAALNPKEVGRARMEEIKFVRDRDLYEKVPKSECYNRAGRAPISVRWIDINNRDESNPNYRSRLVAREIHTHRRDDLFAATFPFEALKVILSMTTIGNRGEIAMTHDISRVFFHARAKRDVYVQLPKEDTMPGEENLCGKLKYSMHGTRDVAQNWYQEYSDQLIQIGFHQGKASLRVFLHPGKGVRTYVHGDDYVSTGKPECLKWMRAQLDKNYAVKTQTLGPGEENERQRKILNRIVTWDDTEGITYEADPRHVEITLRQLKLESAKAVTTPGIREEGRTSDDHQVALGDKETTSYKALVAHCNYLAPDRPDIAFAVEELAKAMSKPTIGDLQRLKRLARYLDGNPRLLLNVQWQPLQSTVTTYSDADWAGCRDSRKSIAGGCFITRYHSIKGWSKTRSLIVLSSGESELYASSKASAETMGVFAMLKDLGWRMHGEVWGGDANATLGVINRKGLGKTRQI